MMKKLLQLSVLPLGVMLSSQLFAQSTCSVAMTSTNNWGSGAQYNLNVKNTGAPISAWNVCFTFNGAEVIGDMWGGKASAKSGSVCVANEPYNGALGTNASVDVGFIVQSPNANIPTAFTLNGVSCGGAAVSSTSVSSVGVSSSAPASSLASSSQVSSSVVSSSLSSAAVSSASPTARWVIDETKSTFHFVPVKNINTAEAMTFTSFSGTVSESGAAVLQIPTTTIASGSTRRDGRMREFLFEVDIMPNLYFTHQLDLAGIDAMAPGSVKVQSMSGALTLHAVTRTITFDALIVKHADGNVSVSPRRPIVMNSNDFDLSAGLLVLRTLANQQSIGERAPVYFKMFLKRNQDTAIANIQVPGAPVAPSSLVGAVGEVSGDVNLVWTDNSSNETGFVVRRQGADGRWARHAHVDANSVSYFENLLENPGTYGYKIIALNQGVGSAESNIVSLTYTAPVTSSSSSDSSTSASQSSAGTSTSSGSGVSSSSGSGSVVGDAARGAQLWESMDCSGCHGKDGEKYEDGTFAMVSVNPNRDLYRHSQDTEARQLAAFIERWMPASNPGTCNAQCAADLEALIRSWRRPSDGIPDKPVAVFSCPAEASSYGQRTLRLLTRVEYQNTVRDILGYNQNVASRLPDDFIAGYFTNNNTLIVDKNRYTSYLATAERIAEDVATRWNSVLNCSPSDSCATDLVDNLGKRLFRRPLTTAERTEYLAVAKGTADQRTAAEGMQVALAAMLSSPQFLYRSELGEASGGAYKLTGYEIATYMSYAYTGTTPSVALLDAAGRGELDTVAGIRQHSAQLLNSSNATVLMRDLVNRWLGTDALEIKEKNAIPDFASVAVSMKTELGKNFAHAMLDSSSTFATVYNPHYTHVNQRLAQLYGLTYSGTPDADGFVRVASQDRGGILLSGAFLSRYATAVDANMITRAVALRRRMMCQDIPEPPSGVSLDREALAARDRDFFESPRTTQRMMYDRITSGTTCSNCHGEIINQLGGSLENFDALGLVRAVDLKGNPINAMGTFFSPYPQLQFLNDPDRVIHSPAITFDGGQDLARTIVEDPLVSGLAQSCLATQMLSYSSGINSIFMIDSDRDVGYARISKAEEDAYRCSVESMQQTLVNQGPRAMLEAIPAMDSVLYRQEWAR